MTRRFTAAACRWLLLALALIAPAAHAAVSEADLLPVDEAYKLTAVAPGSASSSSPPLPAGPAPSPGPSSPAAWPRA